jgi:TPR repeat protein
MRKHNSGWDGMYSEGLHVESQLEKAVCWMEKAAQKRYEAAVFGLANRTAFGIGVNEIWARKAVAYGETYPLVSVAQRYINGNAAPQDIEKGVTLLTEYADKGIGSAQIALAERVIAGKDIPKDTEKALHNLSLAAESGYTSLVSGLGVDLFKSDEKYTDPDMTVQCLELALRAGPNDKWGMFATGRLLYDGVGTEQNREEGRRWISKAAKAGLQDAIDWVHTHHDL